MVEGSLNGFDDLDAVRKVVEALNGFDEQHQLRILRWAREKLGLASEAVPYGPPAAGNAQQAPELKEEPRATRGVDIKTFMELKKPATDRQFAAAVAYFYRFEAPEANRKETINKDDLLEACRQVGRKRFSRPDQTLVDAHGQGLLDREERGAYRINTVGENLVAVALPSDGQSRAPAKKANKKPTQEIATKRAPRPLRPSANPRSKR